MKLPTISVEIITGETSTALKINGEAIERPHLNSVQQTGARHAWLRWPLSYLMAEDGNIGQIHQKNHLKDDFSLGQHFRHQQYLASRTRN